jgi:hypothetical protein
VKRHLTTLLLLVVALVLGVWLWRDKDRVSVSEHERREKNVFPAWRRDEVSRIEIAHDDETIVLLREDAPEKSWKLSSPRSERVDIAAVERLLTTLEFASIVRRVEHDRALGFDTPRASGSVTMGTLRFRFVLGGKSPRPEGSSYLRVDDGAPVVVSKELTEALLASSDTFRDRSVVPYLSLELERFEVAHARGGFVLERRDERSFVLADRKVLASRASLDKAWAALAEMRAEAFPKNADVDALERAPQLTVRMVAKSSKGPPGELLLGGACPGHPADVLVLRTKPTRLLACAPHGALETLRALSAEDLVDRRPFSFRHDEMEELRIEAVASKEASSANDGGKPFRPKAFEVARRGVGFHQREPDDRELSADEADSVRELLVRISGSDAASVRKSEGQQRSSLAPLSRVRVRAGEAEETVELWTESSAMGPTTRFVVRRLRDDTELDVDLPLARRLMLRDTLARGRTLLGDSRRVTRVELSCGTKQHFIDRGSGLSLVDPPRFETDGSIVQLVDAFTRGTVLLWVSDKDDGTFGLESGGNACRVELGFADEKDPAILLVGSEGEGGIYGRLEGRPGVFVAPSSFGELARRIYVSHAALRAPVESIERVRVFSEGRPLTTVDPAVLREGASRLFADRVLSVGSSDIGRPDVEIELTLGDGGATRRVRCDAANASPSGRVRRCSTPHVNAIFEVRDSVLQALLGGASRDAGAR